MAKLVEEPFLQVKSDINMQREQWNEEAASASPSPFRQAPGSITTGPAS